MKKRWRILLILTIGLINISACAEPVVKDRQVLDSSVLATPSQNNETTKPLSSPVEEQINAGMLRAADFEMIFHITLESALEKYGTTVDGISNLNDVEKYKEKKATEDGVNRNDFPVVLDYGSFRLIFRKNVCDNFHVIKSNEYEPIIYTLTIGDTEDDVLQSFYNENEMVLRQLDSGKPIVELLNRMRTESDDVGGNKLVLYDFDDGYNVERNYAVIRQEDFRNVMGENSYLIEYYMYLDSWAILEIKIVDGNVSEYSIMRS